MINFKALAMSQWAKAAGHVQTTIVLPEPLIALYLDNAREDNRAELRKAERSFSS